jgi:hypothetical protein
MDMTPDEVRRRLGEHASDAEIVAVAEWYATLAHEVARFPYADLRIVEPPLHFIPGPRR